MEDDKRVVIPPLHDRPANLMRKMAVLERYIQDLKNTRDYYGWIFTRDPWFAERLREAEALYSELPSPLTRRRQAFRRHKRRFGKWMI